jgi:hypothetical protein
VIAIRILSMDKTQGEAVLYDLLLEALPYVDNTESEIVILKQRDPTYDDSVMKYANLGSRIREALRQFCPCGRFVHVPGTDGVFDCPIHGKVTINKSMDVFP